MKKIIALLLAVVMVFALVACASTAKTEEKTDAPAPAETNNEQTTEPAEETDAPAEDETAEPAGDAVGTDIKIGVVLIGDENEGYTYSHIKGIQEATKALGISESNIIWKYSIPEDESCMTPALTVSTRAARSSSPTPTAISPSAFWQLRNIPMCSSSR